MDKTGTRNDLVRIITEFYYQKGVTVSEIKIFPNGSFTYKTNEVIISISSLLKTVGQTLPKSQKVTLTRLNNALELYFSRYEYERLQAICLTRDVSIRTAARIFMDENDARILGEVDDLTRMLPAGKKTRELLKLIVKNYLLAPNQDTQKKTINDFFAELPAFFTETPRSQLTRLHALVRVYFGDNLEIGKRRQEENDFGPQIKRIRDYMRTEDAIALKSIQEAAFKRVDGAGEKMWRLLQVVIAKSLPE